MNTQLNDDYETLTEMIRNYIDKNKLSVHSESGLQWVIVNLHTNLVNLHESVKKAQEILRKA